MIWVHSDRTHRSTKGPMCGRCRAEAAIHCSTLDTARTTILSIEVPRGWRFVEPEAMALRPPEILCPACVERLELTDADSCTDTTVMAALGDPDEIQLPTPSVLARLLRTIARTRKDPAQ